MGRPNVEHVRQLSASLKTGLPAENFQVGFIERMPFPDAFADVVLCNSILRFTYVIGDGSEWFLVDDALMLLDLSEKMNAVLVDPLKTTIVQDYRCMTTRVLRKRPKLSNSELYWLVYRDGSGGIGSGSPSLQRHHSERISRTRTTSDGAVRETRA